MNGTRSARAVGVRRVVGLRRSWAVAAVLALVGALTLAACSGKPGLGESGGPTQTDAGASWAGVRPSASIASVARTGTQQFNRVHTDVGRLIDTYLDGPISKVRMRVWVWLPPQYDQPRYAHTVFPALMLYPGGTGAKYNAWAGTSLGARELIAAQGTGSTGSSSAKSSATGSSSAGSSATGSAAASVGPLLPFVFVMPQMQLSDTLDTECADIPGQPKVGTFLALDVRQMVVDNFRVSPDRVSWGAAGTSAGAYCAMRVVYNHPDLYSSVASLDGYFTIDTPLAHAHVASVEAGDPQAIATARPPAVSVLIWSGTTGHDLARAKHFMTLVRSPTNAQLRVLQGGQHLTTAMAKMVPDMLAFFSERLAAPATGT